MPTVDIELIPVGGPRDPAALAADVESVAEGIWSSGTIVSVDPGIDLVASVDVEVDLGDNDALVAQYSDPAADHYILVGGVRSSLIASDAATSDFVVDADFPFPVAVVESTGTVTVTVPANVRTTGKNVSIQEVGSAAAVVESGGTQPLIGEILASNGDVQALLDSISTFAEMRGRVRASGVLPAISLVPSDGVVSISETESARVDIATELVAGDADMAFYPLNSVGQVVSDFPDFIEVEDKRGDKVRGSKHYAGQGAIRIVPGGDSQADGEYGVLVVVTDSEGGIDFGVVSITINNPA